jgi:hypothetical protein
MYIVRVAERRGLLLLLEPVVSLDLRTQQPTETPVPEIQFLLLDWEQAYVIGQEVTAIVMPNPAKTERQCIPYVVKIPTYGSTPLDATPPVRGNSKRRGTDWAERRRRWFAGYLQAQEQKLQQLQRQKLKQLWEQHAVALGMELLEQQPYTTALVDLLASTSSSSCRRQEEAEGFEQLGRLAAIFSARTEESARDSEMRGATISSVRDWRRSAPAATGHVEWRSAPAATGLVEWHARSEAQRLTVSTEEPGISKSDAALCVEAAAMLQGVAVENVVAVLQCLKTAADVHKRDEGRSESVGSPLPLPAPFRQE